MDPSATISSRSRSWLLASSFVIAGIGLAAACNGSNASSLTACEDGTHMTCTCPGGSLSTTTCNGGVFDDCVCGANNQSNGGPGDSSGGGTPDSSSQVDASTGMDTSATDASMTNDSGAAEEGAHDGSGGGEGGHHDGSMESGSDGAHAGDAGLDFGKVCTGDGDCTVPYPTCQLIMQQMICTKACNIDADCPDPPTSGSCNMNGYCK